MCRHQNQEELGRREIAGEESKVAVAICHDCGSVLVDTGNIRVWRTGMSALYECGPDDDSTYQQCWGAMATSHGNRIAIGGEKSLQRVAKELGHNNWQIREVI